MKIRLVAFGIAKEILNGKNHNMELEVNTIEELKKALYKDYPEFQKLNSLAFAVNEEYQEGSFQLNDNDEVVLIPPVAGG